MKSPVKLILTVVGIMLIVWCGWKWFFERFYVPPNCMAIIVSKMGKALPPGEILAADGQKGVRKEVLGEGRHFRNPIIYDWQIMPLINIEAGKIGVVTSKIGQDLTQGEFLADAGQKGIQKNVIGPGKYRLNPYGYEITIQDALEIPIGYVGIVTSLSGKAVNETEFVKIGEKGMLSDILQPGLYYINPKQYKIDIFEVGTNQISLIGAMMTRSGSTEAEIIRTKNITNLESQLVVQNKAVQAQFDQAEKKQKRYKDSLYESDKKAQAENLKKEKYNNYNQQVNIPPQKPLNQDSSMNQPIIQFIEFPSKDGFDIRLDMTVEFEFSPEKAAYIYKNFGDLFQVVERIILPQILSISRLKGSAYGARDFIVGEGREKFQDELFEKLKETLSNKGIGIFSSLIRNVIVPEDIRKPIQDASIAVERNLTNIEKQETAKKFGELNTELSLIEQRKEQVMQETQKLKAEIKAQEEKEVAETKAETTKLISEIENRTAEIAAARTRKIARAESDIIKMLGLAEAQGFNLKVSAFGNPNAFSMYEFSNKLPSDLKLTIAHTGAGTLWTDLDKSLSGQLGGLKVLRSEEIK